jgi:exonuclease III
MGSHEEKYTYLDKSLDHFSCIDDFFMSDKLRRSIVAINFADSGINLSDHRPLVATLTFRYEADDTFVKSHTAKPVTYSWH